mmetsp:Transcript_44901/g.100959  ORF Transcript_44901/g.100959 Transcript_44901/m.100959 type:complete len:200 (+) Transcript_44901:823-1422(+)
MDNPALLAAPLAGAFHQALVKLSNVDKGTAHLVQLALALKLASLEGPNVAPVVAWLGQAALTVVLVRLEGPGVGVAVRVFQRAMPRVFVHLEGPLVVRTIRRVVHAKAMPLSTQELSNIGTSVRPLLRAIPHDLAVFKGPLVEAAIVEGEPSLTMLLPCKPLALVDEDRVRVPVLPVALALPRHYRDLARVPGACGVRL